MRILHVIATLDPRAGGPAQYVRTLLNHVEHEVHSEAVTLDSPKSPFLKDVPEDAVHALGPRRLTYCFNPSLCFWLRKNRSRYSGLVVHGLWTFCGLAAFLTDDGMIPWIVFPHGMLDPYFMKSFPFKHLKKRFYWTLVESWVLRKATYVAFTTGVESQVAETIFRWHSWRPAIVPLGCKPPPDLPEDLRESFLRYVPRLRQKRFLLFLGRIDKKKGCELLIHSFILYAHLDPDLHLVMAGPDEKGLGVTMRKTIDSACLTHRVHWLGLLTDDVKWGAFCASEVFILPSQQENFGVAPIEALACGVPVLLTDKVGVAYCVADEGAGLVELDTQEGIDKLVSTWIALPLKGRRALHKQSVLTHKKHYTITQSLLALSKLFHS